MAATFSVQLPGEQKAFLDKLAQAADSSTDGVVSSVVARMMENYEFVMAKVEQGEKDIAAGRVHSSEDVARSTQKIIERHLKSGA